MADVNDNDRDAPIKHGLPPLKDHAHEWNGLPT